MGKKKENECIANIIVMWLGFLCKVDYDKDHLIHTPMSTYNDVTWLLKLVGIVEWVMLQALCVAAYLRTLVSDMY